MSDDWLEVMAIAHKLDMATTATMMFGHVENIEHRVEHLERVRRQQDETGGFTAFIAWTFQAENTKLKAPTVGANEYLRMQALSRIYLDNVPNIQSSWVTQGLEIGQVALKYGANDLGSIMIEENVVSEAGTTFCMGGPDMQRLIEGKWLPVASDNWYRLVDGQAAAHDELKQQKRDMKLGALGQALGRGDTWIGGGHDGRVPFSRRQGNIQPQRSGDVQCCV